MRQGTTRLMRLVLAQPVQEYKPDGVQIKEWVTQDVVFNPSMFEYATWDHHAKKVRVCACSGSVSGWTDSSLDDIYQEFERAFNG